MNIRHRLNDIKALQNHILQAYFQMELEANFTEKEWRDEILDILNQDQHYRHSAALIGVRRKIADNGIDNLTVSDMDAQLIVKLLQSNGIFYDCFGTKLKWVLPNIQEDRNFEAHMTSNETDEELFRWAVTTVQNLKKFVTVCGEWNSNSRLDFDERKAFCAKTQKALDQMSDAITADYRETFSQSTQDAPVETAQEICAADVRESLFELANWGIIIMSTINLIRYAKE